MDNGFGVDAMKYVASLAQEAKKQENRVIEIAGRTCDVETLKPVVFDPRPDPMEDYLQKVPAEFTEKEKLLIHVVAVDEVRLIEHFRGDLAARTVYMVATIQSDPKGFEFGRFYDTESFIIGLMTRFEPTDDRETILKVASCLVSEKSLKAQDTGATTAYTAHAGVVNQSGVDAPKVVTLRPFRTFRQVPQPETAFIFRYRDTDGGPTCALLEADGGAWRHEAMTSIAQYFRASVRDIQVIA
jgi:hypothetical protein